MAVTGEQPARVGGDERLRRLARLADELADVVTERDAVRAVAAAGAQELQADSTSVCLLSADGTRYELAAADGLRPDMAESWSSFPADAAVPVVDAVRTGELVVIEGVADREARYPVFGTGPISSETLIAAPMAVHGDTVIGALAVGFADAREVTDADRSYIAAVADLCGQAVHRARLFESHLRDLARQRLLTDAATVLAAELDESAALQQVAALAVQELADVCAVCLCEEDGTIRTVTAVHRDPDGQAVVDQLVARQPTIHSPELLAVVERGAPVFVPRVPEEERGAGAEDEAHLQLILALDTAGGLAVPMTARGRVIGLLVLTTGSTSAALEEADLQLASQLATSAALAVDNARLYAEQVELVGHLQTALSSHRAIEQAKGVLVARWDVTPTEAFERMRRHARSNRLRMEDIAVAVVAGEDDLPAP